MYIVTDTHPWVWFLTASPRLSQNAKSVLSDSSNLIDISVVTKAPINLDIHDAIIVGTAIQSAEEFAQTVSLVTIDKAIADSKLAPVIW